MQLRLGIIGRFWKLFCNFSVMSKTPLIVISLKKRVKCKKKSFPLNVQLSESILIAASFVFSFCSKIVSHLLVYDQASHFCLLSGKFPLFVATPSYIAFWPKFPVRAEILPSLSSFSRLEIFQMNSYNNMKRRFFTFENQQLII